MKKTIVIAKTILSISLIASVATALSSYISKITPAYAGGNAGSGGLASGGSAGCNDQLYTTCYGATWKYYPTNSDDVSVVSWATSAGKPKDASTPYYHHITGCKASGGYWRYAFVAARDDTEYNLYSKGEQVGLISIGRSSDELDYRNENLTDGRLAYLVDTSKGGGGKTWNEMKAIYQAAYDANTTTFQKRGFNRNEFTNATSTLGWFCGGSDITTTEPVKTAVNIDTETTAEIDSTKADSGWDGTDTKTYTTSSASVNITFTHTMRRRTNTTYSFGGNATWSIDTNGDPSGNNSGSFANTGSPKTIKSGYSISVSLNEGETKTVCSKISHTDIVNFEDGKYKSKSGTGSSEACITVTRSRTATLKSKSYAQIYVEEGGSNVLKAESNTNPGYANNGTTSGTATLTVNSGTKVAVAFQHTLGRTSGTASITTHRTYSTEVKSSGDTAFPNYSYSGGSNVTLPTSSGGTSSSSYWHRNGNENSSTANLPTEISPQTLTNNTANNITYTICEKMTYKKNLSATTENGSTRACVEITVLPYAVAKSKSHSYIYLNGKNSSNKTEAGGSSYVNNNSGIATAEVTAESGDTVAIAFRHELKRTNGGLSMSIKRKYSTYAPTGTTAFPWYSLNSSSWGTASTVPYGDSGILWSYYHANNGNTANGHKNITSANFPTDLDLITIPDNETGSDIVYGVCETMTYDNRDTRNSNEGSSTACVKITVKPLYKEEKTGTFSGDSRVDIWPTSGHAEVSGKPLQAPGYSTSSLTKNLEEESVKVSLSNYLSYTGGFPSNLTSFSGYATRTYSEWSNKTNDLSATENTKNSSQNRFWSKTLAGAYSGMSSDANLTHTSTKVQADYTTSANRTITINLGETKQYCKQMTYDNTVKANFFYKSDRTTPYKVTGRTTTNADTEKVCATITRPYNFDTQLKAETNGTSTAHVGTNTTFTVSAQHVKRKNPAIDGHTTTSPKDYKTDMPSDTVIKVVKYVIPSTTLSSNATVQGLVRSGSTDKANTTSLCHSTIFGQFGSCSEQQKATGKTASVGTSVEWSIPDDATIGDKYCVAIAISHADSHGLPGVALTAESGANSTSLSATTNPNWRISPSACKTVAKRTSFSVWNGGVYTNGKIETSVSTHTIDGATKTFGSWTEQLTIAGTGVAGFGSGASYGYAGYNFALPGGLASGKRSPLTAKNNNDASPGSSGIALSPDFAKKVRDLYLTDDIKENHRTATVATTSYTDTSTPLIIYNNGDINITGNLCTSPICPGSGTTLSSQNLNGLSSPNLPQIIIISDGNINIESSVTRLDAWLIAGGTINTCSDFTVAKLSEGEQGTNASGFCSSQLLINGPISAKNLKLNRTAGSYGVVTAQAGNVLTANLANDGYLTPAEIFNLRADAYLWLYNQSNSRKVTFTTSYSRELAPRY